MKDNKLIAGMQIDNTTLCDIFKCSPQGGMRRSKRTNTLILISNRISSTYIDSWDGDILLYTGMGQKGDQSLNFFQNKTLAESNSNGVTIHLFEVFQHKIYTYYGIMKLVGSPYLSEQKDATGNKRKVYIFPLQRIS